MRLMRVGDPLYEIPVVTTDGGQTYRSAAEITGDYDPQFFATGGLDRLRAAVAADALPRVDIDGMRIGPPVSWPQAIICIGQNYAAHAAESGVAPPTEPIIFFKHPNTLRGAYDDVRIPPDAQRVDWEVELGVVIGSTARCLDSAQEAMACVAGYVVVNDVSERAYQVERSGGQWSKGKACEDFCPVGPVLAVDEVADPQGVAISGKYPYLRAGDVMEIEVDGLGRQRQHVIAADCSGR